MSALNITSGGSYNISESNLEVTIATEEPVTLTGNSDTALSEVVITTSANDANLTINDLNIKNATAAILTVGDGTANSLYVAGNNIFEVSSGPGACVNVGGGLTLNGSGSLKGTSINASVIGINGSQYKPDSNITIQSGTYDLTCRSGACAIGGAGARGNAIGNIAITGTANITAAAPLGHAATIGASYWGSCGDIIINGDAKVNATSGQHSAAVGGASLTSVGNVTISGNAEVNAVNASMVDSSAAIGSGQGSMVQSLGDIYIGGNAKVNASSNLGLAIDNIEYYRVNQEYGTTDEGDYYVTNDNIIKIAENATFNGSSGDIYTTTTINGEEVKAATINYNAADGLTYSGGSSIDIDALEETFMEIYEGGSYTIPQGSCGKILINTTEPVTLQGGDYTLEELQIIGESDSIDLTVSDLKVTNQAVEASVIKFGEGSDNKLTVTGTNDFNIVKGYSAGVNVGGGGTIGGSGSLTVLTLNGAAIGTDGQEDLSSSNIVIDSGTYDLQARSGACGIGGAGNGSKIGNITVTGTANVKADTPQGYGAAIGSAYRGSVGDILINGDATVEATSGIQTAAIGAGVYCESGNITIGGRASVVATATSTDVKDAAIGGGYGEQVKSIGDIKIIEDATVVASSAKGLAIDNRLYVEGEDHTQDYWTVNNNNTISLTADTTTSAQSSVILNNGSTSDIVTIGGSAYQGGKMVFTDGRVGMTGNWTTLEGGGWNYNSVVQIDYLNTNRDDKVADFTLSGENLTDADGDGIPDNVGIGSLIYVQQSGVHTNVRNLSGNVIYNGTALGVEGDNSYNIEAVSPIDLSEEFPLAGYYITDPNVTAMRLISDGATISPRGTAGSETAADWYSFDNAGGTVTFRDGAYCLYPERQFFSRSYTKVDIKNNDNGVRITNGNDLIQTIGNLTDGYALTIESGIAVGKKMNFETSGNGVIVVKTTANSGKYSLASDSSEWQYQRYTVNGGNNFTLIFGDNGSVVGAENFTGTALSDSETLANGSWVTLEGGSFEYTGNTTNDTSKSTKFTVTGDSITNTNNLAVVNNAYLSTDNTSRIGLDGLSGNVTINNAETGIFNDSDYSIHGAIANEGNNATVTSLFNVSDGASISGAVKRMSIDNNAEITFADGNNYTLVTAANYSTGNQGTINVNNGGNSFNLKTDSYKITQFNGLKDGFNVAITPNGNINEEINFKTDGGKGTISLGSTTIILEGDEDFLVDLGSSDDSSIISGLKNFEGVATLVGQTSNADMALALQRGNFTLATDAEYSNATLTNSSGESLNVYYTNNTTGGVIDLSDETLSNALLVGQGETVSVIGSQGDDQLIGNSPNVVQVGNSGNDTFRGGVNLGSVAIVDYTEGEDVIHHGRPFADLSINGSIEGSDYVFRVGTKTITVQNGADKVLSVVDVNGETRNFGKYLTLDDNDPATVTAQSGVSTIDAVLRTTDIQVTGSADDNTIISSSGNCTLYGGDGNDTFVRGSRTAEQTITVADYTEGQDQVYHGRPFADFSLLGVAKSVGDDYIFTAGTASIEYTGGANKKIKFVDVNGDVAYFGNYITIRDYDANSIEATEKVKVLDASERTTDINLVGNSIDNTIIAGLGNSTLWGGESADSDLLIGGDGQNIFVYNKGNGNDTIQETNDGDFVVFNDISLDQIMSSNITSDAVYINFTDGGSLQIEGSNDVTYQLANGSRYSANHLTNTWEAK